MSDIAIRVENLSKLYHIGATQQRHDTLRDALVGVLPRISRMKKTEEIRGNPSNPWQKEDTNLWALRDVSFDVKQGEVAGDTVIGNNVKVQNNVSVYAGVVLEDDVFCGPSCVFTNVINPRAQVVRYSQYQPTLVRRGATIGANATIICGATIGRYAFIGAGAVVRGDVPDYALMLGVPAQHKGWMSRHGQRLQNPDGDGIMICLESCWRYREVEVGVLRCLDWHEDQPLPCTE